MNSAIFTIDSKKRYCVYAHRYADDIFYIGAGKASRPFNTRGRNAKWNKYVNRIESYKIDILLWTDDYSEIHPKETQLIRELKPSCNVNGYGSKEFITFRLTPSERKMIAELGLPSDRNSETQIILRLIYEAYEQWPKREAPAE